eukprot:s7503_g5.t1
MDTLKTNKFSKEANTLQVRIGQCEAAMLLAKKLLTMKINVLRENLLLVSNYADTMPLQLRLKVVQKLAGDLLSSIGKQTQVSVAVEDLKRWTLPVMWTRRIREDDEEMSGDENWLKALEKEKDKLWGSGLRATSIATFNLTTRYQLPTVVPDYNRNCKRS